MKKIFHILVISLMVFTSIFISTSEVKASYTNLLLTGFEGVATGLQNFTSGYITSHSFNPVANYKTDNQYVLDGTRTLNVNNVCSGWLNLTSSFNYIHQINFSTYHGLGGSANLKIEFYDNGNCVMQMGFVESSPDQITWYYPLDIPVLLINNNGPRLYWVITHIDTNDFNVKILDSSFSVLYNGTKSGTYAGDYSTFDSIYIHGTGTLNCWFDNFYIDYSTSIPSYEGYTNEFCNGEINGYLLDTDLKGYRYLESEFVPDTELGINGNITEVKFPLSIDQYTQVSGNLNDYDLYVNGISFGHPDDIVFGEAYEPMIDYWLVWNSTQIALIDDFPIFSFGCSHLNSYGYYWFSIPQYTNTFKPFKFHNSSTQHSNSVFDGYIYFYSLLEYMDLYYCFTVENFEWEEYVGPQTPDDFITTTVFFNFYDAKTLQKLEFIDTGYYFGIRLPWEEGGLFNSYEEGYCVISSLTLTACSDGGNQTHVYTDAGRDYYYSSETVGYPNVVISPYGNNIVQFMGKSDGAIIGYKSILYNAYTNNIILYPFSTYDIYLTRYGETNRSGNLTPIENQTYTALYGDFFVEFEHRDDDYRGCSYYTNEKGTLVYRVNITGYSDVPGYIAVIKNVETNTTFLETMIYEPETEYNGHLTLTTPFSVEGRYRIVVYNITFNMVKDEVVYYGKNIITVCKAPGGGVVPSGNVWEDYGLPFWTGYIIGIFITLFVTMSPLIIAVYINRKVKTNLNIPNLLYVGFFFMGLIISTQIGFLPTWLPFVILFGIIMVFVVMRVMGKKDSAEESE